MPGCNLDDMKKEKVVSNHRYSEDKTVLKALKLT